MSGYSSEVAVFLTAGVCCQTLKATETLSQSCAVMEGRKPALQEGAKLSRNVENKQLVKTVRTGS